MHLLAYMCFFFLPFVRSCEWNQIRTCEAYKLRITRTTSNRIVALITRLTWNLIFRLSTHLSSIAVAAAAAEKKRLALGGASQLVRGDPIVHFRLARTIRVGFVRFLRAKDLFVVCLNSGQ